MAQNDNKGNTTGKEDRKGSFTIEDNDGADVIFKVSVKKPEEFKIRMITGEDDGEGCFIGFRTNTDAVVLMNADSEVPHNAFSRMLRFSENLLYPGEKLVPEDDSVIPKVRFHIIFYGWDGKGPEYVDVKDIQPDIDIDFKIHCMYGTDRSEGPLYDYVQYMKRFRKNILTSSSYAETIEKTVEECKRDGIFTEFLNEDIDEIMGPEDETDFEEEKRRAIEAEAKRSAGSGGE